MGTEAKLLTVMTSNGNMTSLPNLRVDHLEMSAGQGAMRSQKTGVHEHTWQDPKTNQEVADMCL